jgi:hypothetical protein
LQAQLRAANRSGMPTAGITSELNRQLQEQKRIIKVAIGENKAGRNYSIIKEMSLGVKDLVTSIKQVKNTTGSAKKTATKNMINSIGLNLKNTVKAPITITTRILKSTIVATVLFAPISLGMGILHAAWTCLDSSPSPYDNSGVEKMSRGFQSAMNKLNSKIERI